MKKKVLVFASGNGSNFEAIVRYFKKVDKSVEFELLCDIKDANVFKRAKKLKVKSYFVPFKETYNFLSQQAKYDLYVLSGYMRILPEEVINLGVFVNIHPSLLPKYKGINAIKQAYDAGEKETGVTVHYVNKEVDSGKIIVQTKINIEDMTFEKIEETVHKIEHRMYPAIIEKLLKDMDEKYNVLVVGSGAREHALAWKIKQSPMLNRLFLANPNDGFKDLGEEITFKNYKDLASKAKELNIKLVVIGPEKPLSEGIVDIFQKNKIPCIGANKKWARLESSKSFAKKFMQKYSIPTAKYHLINNKKKIDEVLNNFKVAPVLKADGLAAGKGVHVSSDFEDAKQVLSEFLDGKFNSASKTVLVEEKLEGKELSVIALWDGFTLLPFVGARDFKRLMAGDLGPNTGGMGAYCPVSLDVLQEEDLKKYLKTLENALRREKADFTGVIYSGLMLTKDGIKVLEYNMRFGDPETQPLMLHLENDILELFKDTVERNLSKTNMYFKNGSSICVVVGAQGYPNNPKKGGEITNLEGVSQKYHTTVFWAGVKKNNEHYFANGGRVLSVCKTGKNAREDIYKTIAELNFNDKIYRKDIAEGIEGN